MKQTILLALLAIGFMGCNQVQPRYPLVIINIKDYNPQTKEATFALDCVDKVGFNKSDVEIIMPIGNYKIGDTIKFK